MSQKQRNESYSLSPDGPPFTDISCGFFLTLSLTHSIGKKNSKKKKKAGFMERGQKARKREWGRKAKLKPAALLLYLFRPESEALQNKASALLTKY